MMQICGGLASLRNLRVTYGDLCKVHAKHTKSPLYHGLPCQVRHAAQVTVDRHPASQAIPAHEAGGSGSGSGSVPPAAAPLNLGMPGGLMSLLDDNQGPGNASSDPSFENISRFKFTYLFT